MWEQRQPLKSHSYTYIEQEMTSNAMTSWDVFKDIEEE